MDSEPPPSVVILPVKRARVGPISAEAQARARDAWEKNKSKPTLLSRPSMASGNEPTLSSATAFSWFQRPSMSSTDSKDLTDLKAKLDTAKKHGVNAKLMILEAARKAAASTPGPGVGLTSTNDDKLNMPTLLRIDIVEMTPIPERYIVPFQVRSSIPRLTRQAGCDRLIRMYGNELLKRCDVYTEKAARELIERSQMKAIASRIGAAHERELYLKVTNAKDYHAIALGCAVEPIESLLSSQGAALSDLKTLAAQITADQEEEVRLAAAVEVRRKARELEKAAMEAKAKEDEGHRTKKRQIAELFGSDSEEDDEEDEDEGDELHIREDEIKSKKEPPAGIQLAIEQLVSLSYRRQNRRMQHEVDPGQEVKQKISEFVKAVIKPLLKAHLLDRDTFKAVVGSATHKLYESQDRKARERGGIITADFLVSDSESIRKFITAQTIHEREKRGRKAPTLS